MNEPILPNAEAWHSRHENWAAVQSVLQRLEEPPPDPNDPDWYGYEPYELPDFMKGLALLADLGERGGNFLDVGSGLGTKLALAAQFGWKAEGIERHEPYVRVSRQRFPEQPVAHCWADKFDRYHEFDVVFLDRLARKDSTQRSLTEFIVGQMQPSALLWTPAALHPEGLEHVAGLIWRV